MAGSAIAFSSYMGQSVPVKRWELFKSQFFVFFFMFMAIFANADFFGQPLKVLLIPLVGSLFMCVTFYVSERYRFRNEWMSVVLWLVLLLVVLVVTWRGVEKHRQNERLNSNPTAIHP
jgi:uncharacterized membrane protein